MVAGTMGMEFCDEALRLFEEAGGVEPSSQKCGSSSASSSASCSPPQSTPDACSGGANTQKRYAEFSAEKLRAGDKKVQESAMLSVPCEPVVSQEMPSCGAPVRRRLMRKSDPPAWYYQKYVSELQNVDVDWKVRRSAAQLFASHWMKNFASQDADEASYETRREMGRKCFRSMSAGQQAYWIWHVVRQQTPASRQDGQEGRPWLYRPSGLPAETEGGEELRSKGVLLTWNGDWGLAAQGREKFADPNADPDVVARALAEEPYYKDLFDRFYMDISKVALRIGFIHISAAMEMSLESEANGRIHLQLYASHPTMRARLHQKIHLFKFEDVAVSHVAATMQLLGNRIRTDACSRAHYYLQMRKKGTVLQKSNYLKNRNFAIKAEWVLAQWRLRKLSHENARLELIEGRHGVHRGVSEIDRVQLAESMVRMKKVQKELAQPSFANNFGPPNEVELEWLRQFLPQNRKELRRFRPLVYDGPSRTGKTERSMRWFGADNTLLLNCQGQCQPNLKEWLQGMHRCIVYDEASWKLIHTNKLLFQSPPSMVMLGQSQCNEHAYSVFVYQTPMVVCSNNFWDGVDDGAAEWLRENIYYVKVTGPLWLAKKEAVRSQVA